MTPTPWQPPPARGLSKTAVAVLFLCVGLGVGFIAGIGATKAGSAFLEDLVTSEQAADVAHSKSHVRPGYSFKYPGNWKIDMDDPEQDLDHHVNVESPGSCMVMLFVFDLPTDPADNLQKQVDALVPKLIATPSRTPFTAWGKYTGQGVILKGKILGINPGSIRVFSHATDKRSFIVAEQCYDEDMTDVKPGFSLLESSFELSP